MKNCFIACRLGSLIDFSNNDDYKYTDDINNCFVFDTEGDLKEIKL